MDEYSTVAELYDYVVPYATRGDVEFFVDEALAANGPVLEIGGGTGRVREGPGKGLQARDRLGSLIRDDSDCPRPV